MGQSTSPQKNNSVIPNNENIYIYLSVDGSSISKINGIFKYDYIAWLSYYDNKKKEYQTPQLWASTEKDEKGEIPVGPLSLDEIKKDLLNFLYNRARARKLKSVEITHTLTEKLIIEVFLPDELLDHNIEDWLADGETEVGYSYPIVTRSYTRTFKTTAQQWRDKCKVKWEAIEQICDLTLLDFLTNVTLSNSLNFIDIKHQKDNQNLELTPFNCTKKEELKGILSKQETISCILLNKELFDTAPNILRQAIIAGIPIVLFFRENLADKQKELLSKSSLLKEFFNLPKILHKERQNKLLTKVSLLWDDPTRGPLTKNNKPKKHSYKTPS